ncbi:hypothetical protein GCM10025876_08420 [Demequina litorisediminis]|uniref:Uncharacterized protein n=1 Tax=Demequina litorisediminis TaxID=1849022 RepID=A0ABQ6ID25_9MICO|nr:hypothetical protein GCM10025876_08420 [Demequina litorisediminis]
MINHWLGFIGIGPIAWHVDVIPSHLAIASMVNFRWIGYNTLILLAAMQAIPREALRSRRDRWRRQGPPLLLRDAAADPPDGDLRHHHVDHRWSADLRRAAHVRHHGYRWS